LLARIGETEEQCLQRYGKPVRHDCGENPAPATCVVYAAGRFEVKCYFVNGRVGALLMFPRDHSPLLPDEIELLMSANSGGSTWQLVKNYPDSDLRVYRRSDGRATLQIIRSYTFFVESVEWKAAKLGMSKL
jgi:hypothetical protein